MNIMLISPKSWSAAAAMKWWLLGLVVLVNLVVLPISEQVVTQPKWLIIVIGALGSLLIFVWHSWQQRHLAIVWSPISPWVLALGGAALISSLAAGSYTAEHFLGLGGVVIAWALLIIIGSSVLV